MLFPPKIAAFDFYEPPRFPNYASIETRWGGADFEPIGNRTLERQQND